MILKVRIFNKSSLALQTAAAGNKSGSLPWAMSDRLCASSTPGPSGHPRRQGTSVDALRALLPFILSFYNPLVLSLSKHPLSFIL
jgi:hypothetical protein